ncbi:MAG: putative membrane protein YfcA [Bradymonadia bacterium]
MLSVIVFIAFTIHSVTGFASMITALSLGAWFFPLEEIRPALVLLSMLLNLYFVIRSWSEIDRSVLLQSIFPFMGFGTLVGFGVSGYVEGPLLRRMFGLFVISVSLFELYRFGRGEDDEEQGRVSWAWLMGAGIVHGIYATGGPPLVFALAKARLEKSALRATLCAVWSVFNLGLVGGFLWRRELDSEAAILAASLVPVCFLAILCGSWLHTKLNGRYFRLGVLCLLAVTAVGLVIR